MNSRLRHPTTSERSEAVNLFTTSEGGTTEGSAPPWSESESRILRYAQDDTSRLERWEAFSRPAWAVWSVLTWDWRLPLAAAVWQGRALGLGRVVGVWRALELE